MRPTYIICNEKFPTKFGIEVVNLSVFPVFLSEVGFILNKDKKYQISEFISIDGKNFPIKIESRESVRFIFEIYKMGISDFYIKKAYILTLCGYMKYGTSPALKDIIKLFKKMGVDHGKIV
ncbi:hypothetical protein GCM10011505_46940 [Tistrella bauzanensis]|uniref:Uncharacterized protein n=1 Tax=Tistrella bauzanensis TaxID=657419 RepID=A0ABQ1J606_9PROT|nr:hypothetical protein GCM10011505_46940 [Tistrella bauzanensis]